MPREHLIKLNNKDIMIGGFISVSNVALYLNVSGNTVREWIKDGKLKGYQNTYTRSMVLKTSEFLDWVDIHYVLVKPKKIINK